MKIGVVDYKWVPSKGFVIPKPEEWWMVHIVHETRPGTNRGCLIMRPIAMVELDSMNALIPGFYTPWKPDPSSMIITPKHDPNGNWYMPLKLKNELMISMGLSLMVVNLGGDYWRTNEGPEKVIHKECSGNPGNRYRDSITSESAREAIRRSYSD